MKRKGEKASILDGIAVLAAVFVILGRAVRVQGLEKVLIYAVHADRLFFDVLTVCLLIRRFIRKKAAYPLSREFMLFVGMMAVWILWGGKKVSWQEPMSSCRIFLLMKCGRNTSCMTIRSAPGMNPPKAGRIWKRGWKLSASGS